MDCKYMLPCGRCDKHGEPCEALINELKMMQEEFEAYKKKHCEHDWRIVGSVAGTKAQYQVFVCSKCGAQQTQKTIIGRDGTYAVCLIDETND